MFRKAIPRELCSFRKQQNYHSMISSQGFHLILHQILLSTSNHFFVSCCDLQNRC
jgi:hypothetical protein